MPKSCRLPTQHYTCRSFTLTITLATSFGMLVLVTFLAAVWPQLKAGWTNIYEQFNQEAMTVQSQLQYGMQNIVNNTRQQLLRLNNELEHRIYAGLDDPALHLIRGALLTHQEINELVYWPTAGKAYAVQRTADNLLVRFKPPPRPKTCGHNQQLLGEARIRHGLPGFDMWIKNQHGSCIQAFMTIAQLSELTAMMSDMFDGTVFILKGKEHVIAHPNLISPHPEQTVESPLVGLKRVGDMVLGSLWDEESHPLHLEDAANHGAFTRAVDIGDEHYIVIYGKVTGYGPEPWLMGAWVNASEMDAPFERMALATLSAIVTLIIAILAAVWLGRRIAQPIRRAASYTSALGDLEFTQAQKLPSSRITEVKDLANGYNGMLEGLRAFERYVPRKLVRNLIDFQGQQGEQNLDNLSDQRQLAVMFTDIAGFTSLSETLSAPEVATLLNDHFTLLGSHVENTGGTIDKYIGDALMAFWGAPDPMPESSTQACYAALAMRDAMQKDNLARQAAGKPTLQIRIGIHLGDVVVGNIGAPGRINYTIVGDTVNSCQRLESLGRHYATPEESTIILVSGQVAGCIGENFATKHVGEHAVKGRQEPLEVFQLLGLQDTAPKD
ncbi:adenylate/guanylate cyclase domain-containing protein [Magnetococcus sp. PR-3]|uniref:adenylate/guanylate cyclase domain-containing protein n=1 Tax=Magnetococcus sp. PR-3 TaxID=3120355 RepID=UPI002FCE5FDC